MRLALIALLVPAAAGAEPIAVATNAPIMWPNGVAASVYVPVFGRDAIRFNAASYVPLVDTMQTALAEDDFHSYELRNTDLGIGYVSYPDKRYEGYMFEVGALVRFRRETITEWDTGEAETRYQHIYGGRALVGWSWRFWRRGFAAAAFGGSVGYERVEQKMTGTWEGYLRFGVVI